jgi:hypothetical protein
MTTKPRCFSGDYGSENKLTMGGIGFGYGDPSPLGTTRYPSHANQINAGQSK